MKNFSQDEVEELIGPICHLADQPLSTERINCIPDPEMDILIIAARMLKTREGFEAL